MSVVTGVTLICNGIDGDEEDGHGNDVPAPVIRSLNAWLEEHEYGPLVSVENAAGGNKHPQCCIYAAGYNGFRDEEFVEQFLAAPWSYPEEVILVMNPEEGAMKVFAPPSIGSKTHGRTWCDYIDDVCPICETRLIAPSRMSV
jgi:hypothetical protein